MTLTAVALAAGYRSGHLLAAELENVRPGWVALIIVLVLGVATFLLWRSMNRQLGKIKAPHQADIEAARDRGNAAHETEVDDRPEQPGDRHQPGGP